MSGAEKVGAQDVEILERVDLSPKEQSDFVLPTAEEEKQVVRKLDRRLLPLVFLLYTLSVLDRSNLGNARLAGLSKAVDLSGNNYALLGTTFYIAYILFQWTVIFWKQFRPSVYCACVVVGWGLIASAQAGVTNWSGLMACRFFLGITEAMYGPGVPLYLSFFYQKEKVGFRHGVFISGAAMANAYGGALAYGISQIRGSLAPWQILFLIEGLPTILFAVVAFKFLPDSLSTAKFLTAREKEVALHMVSRGQRIDTNEEGGDRGVRIGQLFEAFKDPKAFIPALMYFGCNVSFASLPLFLPTIIAEIGTFSQIQSNGLSAPPYVLCFIVVILFCWLSDRYQMRGPFCALAATLAGIGFIINASTVDTAPRYFSVFLCVLIFASVALSLTWTANLHGSESKRSGGFVILATIGQCGPLLGTNVFPNSDKPYFRKGMWISAAMCLMVAALSVTLSLWIRHENRQIDREEAEAAARGEDVEGNPRRKFKPLW